MSTDTDQDFETDVLKRGWKFDNWKFLGTLKKLGLSDAGDLGVWMRAMPWTS